MRLLRPLLLALGLSAVFAPGAHAIVGGTDVPAGQRGYVAYIRIDSLFACTGTLISPTVVVTAGHCSSITGATPANVPIGQPGQAIEVTLGSVKRNDPAGEKHTPSEVIVHEDYSFTNLLLSDRETDVSNDVALLRLPAPSKQTPVPVAAVGERDLWEAGDVAQIAGFGTTRSGGTTPAVMQETTVPITTDEYAQNAYRGSFENATQIGAGLLEGGRDTCQGDSGGPLLVPAADGSLRLVGDTSYGDGCAKPGKPGIYGRVAGDKLRAFVAEHAPDGIAPEPAAPSTAPSEPAPSQPGPSESESTSPTATSTDGREPAQDSPPSSSSPQPGPASGGPPQSSGAKAAPARLRLITAVGRARLSTALRRGLRLRARCSVRCSLTATVRVSRGTARRLDLKSRTVGRATTAVSGRRVVQVRFTKAAARRLRRAGRVALGVRFDARSGDGQRRTVTRAVTIR
ncbi:MAG: trypsin-like serine protease [Actinomycetota bacterium]|nr:trypsin-like serine protease [Actinomycetota bacterium]